jgi:hypothetical protein
MGFILNENGSIYLSMLCLTPRHYSPAYLSPFIWHIWSLKDRTSTTSACAHSLSQVQKSAEHYTEAAQDEITLCSQIRDGDPRNDRHCVRMFDSFVHSGPYGRHQCMVFEVLGENLLALIKM